MTAEKSILNLTEKIESAMNESILALQSLLRIEKYESSTHHTVIVTGWDNDRDSKHLIAQYLVGLRASAIDCALNIKAYLLEDSDVGKVDLRGSVSEIVGASNDSLTKVQKRDERNPWLAEAIWHLCLVLANKKPEIHPPGRVIAVKDVHVKAKDHGLDGLALYVNDQGIGLSVIESKAYKNDPSRAIEKAIKYFKEIDGDKHTTRIRQDVNAMRIGLPRDVQEQVRGLFWNKLRTYMPNPHYDAATIMDWTQPHNVFSRHLSVDKESIIVMPHIIRDFDRFFEEISDLMREFVEGL
ncbi:hypothetical protein [Ferroacidibacillus organovorans]|uniref:Anti-bacteriophage protein A/HamA C-terminal domain-containing protein n=1 Tax=Ferroacidibacillus organovorans TaxID=1765683 RepID=A0A853K936_9BACL|nr:hypothetical protein [Ferroacidibacillus organovorans]KYP79597.1 hypothetical protein AYJ22_14130 [Ferroacidibacillus organovorans]OAG91648.1 hypothetical protein AYW79_13680 [Ferroacidibacillus organovorans]